MPPLFGGNDAVYARDKAAHAQINEASLACNTRIESEEGLLVELPSVGRVDGLVVVAVLEIVV